LRLVRLAGGADEYGDCLV